MAKLNITSPNGTAYTVDISSKFGSCSTAAATAAKVVACTGWDLHTGNFIFVKFTVTNTAASPTLNVNSTGAKAIWYNGAAVDKRLLVANHVYLIMYDGTRFNIINDVLVGSDNHIITPAGELWIA
jgi:hypothetical protein